MKQALLLLLAVSVEGVAGDVGASNPHIANTAPATLAAIVDTGASNLWTAQPAQTQVSHEEIKQYQMRVEGIDVKVNTELDALISHKIETLLAQDR